MSRANIGIYGEELYEQVLPLHGPDPDGLAHDYIGALTSQAIEVDDLARDDAQGRPGWGAILDIDACPIKGLPWLSQIAGVSLRDPKLVPVFVATIANANGELGSTAGWTTYLSSLDGTPTLTTASGHLAAPGGFHSHLTTAFPSGGAWMIIRPNSPAAMIPARPNLTYGFAASLYITHSIVDAPGWNFQLDSVFLDADLNVLEDNTSIDASPLPSDSYTVGSTIDLQGYRDAPAGTAYAAPYVRLPGVGTGSPIDAQIDVGQLIAAPISNRDDLPTWPYSPPMRLEAEEEWAVYARAAIRRQGGRQRGTPDAILSAAEDTLKGAKVGRLLERVGGNAYALELVTRPSETPNPAATLAAAMSQKPAGMSLTHTLTEGVIINEGTRTIDTSTATIDTATLGDVT